ncbi:MAG TPA: efflux transporter outer membrane subunit, partial [Nitrospira sp.]|nr:efflux transporter outer membrane subunit [Nitrospira sp.]
MTDSLLHTQFGMSRTVCWQTWVIGFFLLTLSLSACNTFPAFDLSPTYQPPEYVVPASWRGASPFVEANPSDDELRPDWWKLYDDPVLDSLVEQAMAANPNLQAAAERFLQARDMMMKARSQYFPRLGLGFGASDNRASDNALFFPPGISHQAGTVSWGGLASWEPDFWSALRNAARIETFRAQERAADFGLARLSLQAEIGSSYWALRGYDAQIAIYTQSIVLYKRSLDIVKAQFAGAIASALDVARVESLLFTTETQLAKVQGQRQVTEQAIAILVNMAPSNFTIKPVDDLRVATFTIPRTIPSTVLERRPDIAGMERQMAQASRAIGIARAAFYPNVTFRVGGGFEDAGVNLAALANSFWSYGATVSLPLFQAGFRRAQLQQSWSAYREMEDRYRSTVLNAFREVENNLSLTNQLTLAANRQDAAVGATFKAQNLTTELYQ